MEKYIDENGRVAVLYSPGYGAGWSTWNGQEKREALCMDRRIVEAVIQGDKRKAAKIAEAMWPGQYVCVLGADDLEIEWMQNGTAYEVSNYDGNESIQYAERSWSRA